jgi:hypothetical protein
MPGSLENENCIYGPGTAISCGVTLDIRNVIHDLIAQAEALGGFPNLAEPRFFVCEQECHLQRETQQGTGLCESHLLIKGHAVDLTTSRGKFAALPANHPQRASMDQGQKFWKKSKTLET